MEMCAGRRLLAAFLAATLIGISFLAWIFLQTGIRTNLLIRNTTHVSGTVSYENGVQIQTVLLPADTPGSVMFKTTHTKVEVRADDVPVYRYGWEEDAPAFLKSPGTLWHIVTLPENYAGGELQVRLHPVYPGFYGNTSELIVGTRAACTLDRLVSILPILILNCTIIFAGILSIFLHFVTEKRRDDQNVGSFICIGALSLSVVTWSLCQCGFLQFLIPSGRTLYFVDFFSFFLFPVPFNLFIHSICRTRYRKGFTVLAGAYLVNMAGAIVIQLSGWMDIFEILRVTHGLMMVNVVYVFWGIRGELRLADSDIVRRFRLPLYIVITFALAELVTYYFRDFRDTSFFLPIGIIVFIIMLVWLQVSQYYEAMLEEQKLAYFEKLANMDILTEALNRNAYEDTLRDLERREREIKGTCVVLFDINDMKGINDNFGHEQGDQALKSCYHCITTAFHSNGKCFRIGGDEFVYISSQPQDLQEACGCFRDLIQQESEQFDFPFSVSYGFASYDPAVDRTVRDVIRRSDEMMYENKKRRHELDLQQCIILA